MTALTANLKLSKLTLTKAIAAAVDVNGGTVKISKSKISGNKPDDDSAGGGVAVGAGTTATIAKSTISGNTARNGGGGIYANGDVDDRRLDDLGQQGELHRRGPQAPGRDRDSSQFDLFGQPHHQRRRRHLGRPPAI